MSLKTRIPLLFVDPYSEVYINLPNMSLAYAATIYNAPVVDQHILPYPRDRFMKYPAETLAISLRSFAYQEARRVKEKYQRRYPQAKIKSVDALDVQCCYPFFNFAEKISLGVEFSDALPFPRYELLDSANYLITNWQSGLWHYPLLTSLGCPFSCIFCAGRDRPYRKRSVDNCISELKQAVEKYHIRSFEIIDDVFNLDKMRVREFCDKVQALKLSWRCSNGLRADHFDEEQARALKQSGCEVVGFGIESIDDEVLTTVKKGENSQQIIRAVEIARKYFSEVWGYFIIGLPGSSKEKDRKSIEWAMSQKIKIMVSYYLPDSNKISDEKDPIFYGSAARPHSGVYPEEEQRENYRRAKGYVRKFYHSHKIPWRLLWLTLKNLTRYNLYSIYTLLLIGPRRLWSIIRRGEVQ